MNDNFKKTNRISMLQQLLINGSEQTIMINGDDRSNPAAFVFARRSRHAPNRLCEKIPE